MDVEERRLAWNNTILLADDCAGGCVHGSCSGGSCTCDTGYEGSRCEDTAINWMNLKILTKPEGLAVSAVVVLVILLVALILLYKLRVLNDQAGGRFRKVVRAVLQGHELARESDPEAAASMYRTALLHVCHSAFAAENSSAPKADAESGSGGAGAAAVEADKALTVYNSMVGLGTSLAFALPSETSTVPPKLLSLTWERGLDAEVENHRVVKVSDGGNAAEAGLKEGDRLVLLNGEDASVFLPEALQQQLQAEGSASFQRDDVEEQCKVFLCCRCANGNTIAESAQSFRCFSCQATVVAWDYIIAPSKTAEPKNSPFRNARVWPEEGYPQYQGLTWENCELNSAIKHPLGFGKACDVPEDCQHHKQVGATCGVAAVNNLITNCSAPAVDAEHLMAISKSLGQAEAAIRDGAESVEEAGEQQQVSELYASSTGGHFDVQTLQIAFDEAGFNMWYVPAQKVQKPASLFEHAKDSELAGYVLHRKDPLNPRRDHWFVLRRHGAKKRNYQYLVQDSLFEKVFDLTCLEAHHLLIHMPPGALFAVSRKPRDAPKSGDVHVENC